MVNCTDLVIPPKLAVIVTGVEALTEPAIKLTVLATKPDPIKIVVGTGAAVRLLLDMETTQPELEVHPIFKPTFTLTD